jgi:hypothetical protein
VARLRAASAAAIVVAILASSVAVGLGTNLSGLVPNNASWAYYTTQRYATDQQAYEWLEIDGYPNGDHVYVYERRCVDNNPIGYGTPTSPIVFTKPSTVAKKLGNLVTDTCFRLTARKDWTWISGSEWWTGFLWW